MLALDAGTFDQFCYSFEDAVIDDVDFALQLHIPPYRIEMGDVEIGKGGLLLYSLQNTPFLLIFDEFHQIHLII